MLTKYPRSYRTTVPGTVVVPRDPRRVAALLLARGIIADPTIEYPGDNLAGTLFPEMAIEAPLRTAISRIAASDPFEFDPNTPPAPLRNATNQPANVRLNSVTSTFPWVIPGSPLAAPALTTYLELMAAESRPLEPHSFARLRVEGYRGRPAPMTFTAMDEILAGAGTRVRLSGVNGPMFTAEIGDERQWLQPGGVRTIFVGQSAADSADQTFPALDIVNEAARAAYDLSTALGRDDLAYIGTRDGMSGGSTHPMLATMRKWALLMDLGKHSKAGGFTDPKRLRLPNVDASRNATLVARARFWTASYAIGSYHIASAVTLFRMLSRYLRLPAFDRWFKKTMTPSDYERLGKDIDFAAQIPVPPIFAAFEEGFLTHPGCETTFGRNDVVPMPESLFPLAFHGGHAPDTAAFFQHWMAQVMPGEVRGISEIASLYNQAAEPVGFAALRLGRHLRRFLRVSTTDTDRQLPGNVYDDFAKMLGWRTPSSPYGAPSITPYIGTAGRGRTGGAKSLFDLAMRPSVSVVTADGPPEFVQIGTGLQAMPAALTVLPDVTYWDPASGGTYVSRVFACPVPASASFTPSGRSGFPLDPVNFVPVGEEGENQLQLYAAEGSGSFRAFPNTVEGWASHAGTRVSDVISAVRSDPARWLFFFTPGEGEAITPVPTVRLVVTSDQISSDHRGGAVVLDYNRPVIELLIDDRMPIEARSIYDERHIRSMPTTPLVDHVAATAADEAARLGVSITSVHEDDA